MSLQVYIAMGLGIFFAVAFFSNVISFIVDTGFMLYRERQFKRANDMHRKTRRELYYERLQKTEEKEQQKVKRTVKILTKN